ncbi:MAG: dephospho-CoA kinase [Verrucomicrobia bacterium]|jgi:dephospho-CoA kinase|nr:dephospho-CoA kinase [Verrucomicrobiota bacterium]
MSVVGITGGIGMGKSTIASMLSASGREVVDTDFIARQLTLPNGEAIPEILSSFGPEVIASDGGLNRAAMAERIFNRSQDRLLLESILHPRIRRIWQDRVSTFRTRKSDPIFVVIPLLFETRSEQEFDHIICIACTLNDQRNRLRDRGFSESDAEARIRSQWSIEKKMDLSDTVVWTSCRLEITKRQLGDPLGSCLMSPASGN